MDAAFNKTDAKLFIHLTAGFGCSFTISEVMNLGRIIVSVSFSPDRFFP